MRYFGKYSLLLFFFSFSIFTLQTQANAESNVDFLLLPVKEVEQSSRYYREKVDVFISLNLHLHSLRASNHLTLGRVYSPSKKTNMMFYSE